MTAAKSSAKKSPVGKQMVKDRPAGRKIMSTAVILIVLWLLGLVSSYTMGGLIHSLLVIAIIVVVLSFIKGRK